MSTSEDWDKTVAAVAGADEFYRTLGLFVLRFAEIEAHVHEFMWDCSGLSSPIAQAALPETVIDRAITAIRRIVVAQNWEKDSKALFDRTFQQLDLIKDLRNNILHRGASLEGPDAWRVSTRGPKNVSESVISPQTLRAAIQDLDQIAMLLLALGPAGRSQTLDRAALDEASKCDWQYRPK